MPAPEAPPAAPAKPVGAAQRATSRPTQTPGATPPLANPRSAAPRSARTPAASRPSKPVPVPFWRDRLTQYALLMRLDRPVGFLLLLWPTWWGLWLAAAGFPPLATLAIFTLGVALMRAAGCSINDYADRWLDPGVQRTRERPLASGRIRPAEALLLASVLALAAFGLVLLTNTLTVRLALVGAFLAASYPFLKRYTYLPQLYLGIAFGWSIIMAFAAVTGSVPPLAWLTFLANVLWATAYDTLYAMVDRDDDIRMGAKSTAILFGDADRMIVAVLQATFLLAMAMIGQRAELGWTYFAAVGVATALCLYQQWLIRDRSREHCFAAFRNNQWVGAVLFAGLALGFALKA